MTIKCVECGRFIPYSQMEFGGGARFYFEPDSHKGPEVSEWTCKECTEHEDDFRVRAGVGRRLARP